MTDKERIMRLEKRLDALEKFLQIAYTEGEIITGVADRPLLKVSGRYLSEKRY